MVEDHLTAVVCFVEEIQILQNGGIIEDSLHDVMPAHPGDLTHQQESELVGRVDLTPPRLPLSLVLLLLQRLRLLVLLLQVRSVSGQCQVSVRSLWIMTFRGLYDTIECLSVCFYDTIPSVFMTLYVVSL